jgi:hypothetical protein
MSVTKQSSQIGLLVVMALGLFLAFGVNPWPVIGQMASLLIIAAAMIWIFTTRFPRQLVAKILGLLVGPFLFCHLFSALLAMFQSLSGPAFSKPLFFLMLFALMVISFLYVRWQIAHLGSKREELQTNERKPLLPVQAEPMSEVNQCVASSSSRESSGED